MTRPRLEAQTARPENRPRTARREFRLLLPDAGKPVVTRAIWGDCSRGPAHRETLLHSVLAASSRLPRPSVHAPQRNRCEEWPSVLQYGGDAPLGRCPVRLGVWDQSVNEDYRSRLP